MGMFGKNEPVKAANRLSSFPDGKYIVSARAFVQELLGDKFCHKIQYTCQADASTAAAVDPGKIGELALFPLKKDKSYTYVAKDLANYYSAALPAELGEKAPYDPDVFVMNADSKNGGTPLAMDKNGKCTEPYPAGEDIALRRAWLDARKDNDGHYSIEELLVGGFRSARPLVLLIETRKNTTSDGSIQVHQWELPTPKLMAWYKAEFIDKVQAQGPTF